MEYFPYKFLWKYVWNVCVKEGHKRKARPSKEPLNILHFCGKRPVKIRHPISLAVPYIFPILTVPIQNWKNVWNVVFCNDYRVAKTHRMPYLYMSLSAKVTYISWLFCGK